MELFEQDNIIQFIFEKIFDQKTLDGKELLNVPFNKISEKTFHDEKIHQIINDLTHRPLNKIRQYLSHPVFQEKFLFVKLKKKIHVQILLNNSKKIFDLIEKGYKFDIDAMYLTIINNQFELIKYFSGKLTNKMLSYAVEFGHEDIYFYLIEQGLIANIQIFHKAILGSSLKIIKSINENITLTDKILKTAFQMNKLEVILFLVKDTVENEIKILPDLMHYPILNANIELLENLKMIVPIIFKNKFYFSALLSGSMEMIKYIENKIPNIHNNWVLDTSKTKKGYITLLSEEITYQKNNKKYFSHTMNYAIQSCSIEVIEYIISKDYGITFSNIITAIKTGNVKIVSLILQHYKGKNKCFIYYFGMHSFISNKFAIAKIIYDYHNCRDLLYNTNMTITDYKRETLHLNLIKENSIYISDDIYDIDYLMKYSMFFVPISGFKLNYKLLTTIRLYLELNLDDGIVQIFHQELNKQDLQHVVDSIYLFGDLNKIKKFVTMAPSPHIIMESLCYNQIGKFCYLMQKNMLSEKDILQIYPIITMLADPILDQVTGKFHRNFQKDPKYIFLSGKFQNINNAVIDIRNIRDLLLTDDIEFIKKFNLIEVINDEIIDWAIGADLIEVAIFLKSIINSYAG
jgi:hypothetical protein